MVHNARFGEAGGGVQHGIIERALGDYLDGFYAVPETPFFGLGLGMGTNAGAGLVSGGQRIFLLAEGEWARVVKECGPILGLSYLFLRVSIAFYMGLLALGASEKKNPLALLIFSASFLVVLSGQFGQPTALGFAVFGAGLCLAATNETVESKPRITLAGVQTKGLPGRSVYSELLHGK